MTATLREKIDDFLASGPFGVAGASANRAKFGNRVLRCYLKHDKAPLYAIHPAEKEIEGVPAFPDVASVPVPLRAISLITPPAVSESIVRAALDTGVSRFWFQPGAESEAAVEAAENAGASVIAGGPCLLVELGE